jgi:hypothetical protein
MRMRRSHLHIALAVLAAAVLFNVWSFMKPAARTTGPQRQQTARETDAPPTTAGAEAIDPLTIPAPPEIDMSRVPSTARDPFLFGDETRDQRLQTAQVAETPDPMVRSILFSATRKAAMIEHRMVSIGDSVGSLMLTDIERDAVVFITSTGERRRVLLHRAMPAGITR